MSRTFAVLGVPSSAGARRIGQESAPQALRAAGLLDRLRAAGAAVVDRGDLPQVTYAPDLLEPKRQNLDLVAGVARRVARAVEDAAGGDALPLVLGGDCTITLGVLAGLARRLPSLGMIYLDADLDLNTPETTPSGIFDGMVLAHVLGGGAEELSHLGPRHPLLCEDEVVPFAHSLEAGGIDPPEIDRFRKSKLPDYSLAKVGGNPRAAAVEALRSLESRVDRILVHFDVDVIDARDFPAADVPHHPGLPLAAAQEALRIFVASPKLAGIVVTEFNARRDVNGTAARTLVEMLGEAVAG